MSFFAGSLRNGHIYRCDLAGGASNLVDVSAYNPSRPADGAALAAGMSDDGRFVVFLSQANDLAADDTNGFTDLYVRDLVTSNTTLVTASLRGGRSGPGLSGPVSLGADGQTVVIHGDTASASNPAAPRLSRRFYRALLVL